MAVWGIALAAALATIASADEPLRVRVLEHQRPNAARLEVHSGTLSCDGKATAAWLSRVKIVAGQLQLGETDRCSKVTAPDASIRLASGDERRYRGTLELSVDGTQLKIIDVVSPEEYLASVVASELHAPPEAMKAQAVVSRTYAAAMRHRHQSEGYDLCDLTHCQLYLGRAEENAAASAAVVATANQVLQLDRRLTATFFHANCGGSTSSPRDVFGESGPGVGVAEALDNGSPVCGRSPDFEWTWEISRAPLARALGVKPVGPAVEPTRRDGAGRVLELKAFGLKMSGREFQARLAKTYGYLELRSLKFNVGESGERVQFHGYGLGHGVGLCQQGAAALAAKGQGFRQILSHYFPGGELVPLDVPMARSR